MAIDYSLYLITDRELVGSKDFFSSVRKASPHQQKKHPWDRVYFVFGHCGPFSIRL